MIILLLMDTILNATWQNILIRGNNEKRMPGLWN